MTEFFSNFHLNPAMAVEANGFAFKSPDLLLPSSPPNPKPQVIDGEIPVTEKTPEEVINNNNNNNNNTSTADHGGDGSDSQDKTPRLPRWTRQEILVLIEGKRVVESRGKKSRLIFDGQNGQVNTESKWSSISSYCKRHGVNREPVQCRKRWSNLSGDYKKIRDWESCHKDLQSFWLMRNDIRRENKLPGFFDREVYNILDGCIGKQDFDKQAIRMPEAIFDSGRPCVEEGLFSDFEHSAQEEIAGSPDKEAMLESPSTTAATTPPPPLRGGRTEKVRTPNAEKGSASCASGQKRKRILSEGKSDNDLRDQLLSVLERNSRVLTAHVEAQNLNCELDRNQRRDHADSLVGVLGKLADALGRIADKL
eukprot:Gb_12642 [translate_table: standard]